MKITSLAYISRFRVCAAFGMLIRRFGVFWRPLEVKFKRRAPLIAAIMRLHNYCIDRRITLELREVNGCTEIQPRVWLPTPLFDDDGRPLDFLDTCDHSAKEPVAKNSTRNKLKAGLESNGLKRPAESSREAALRAVRQRTNTLLSETPRA